MILRKTLVIPKKCDPKKFLNLLSRSCSSSVSTAAAIDQQAQIQVPVDADQAKVRVQADVTQATTAKSKTPPLGVFFVKNKCFSLEMRSDLGKKKLINLVERDLCGSKRMQIYLNLHEIFVLAERLRLLQKTIADLERCSHLVTENNHLYSDRSEIEGNLISLDMVENLRGRFINISHKHKLFGDHGPLVMPIQDIPHLIDNLSKTLHSCSEPDTLDGLNTHEELMKARHADFIEMFLSSHLTLSQVLKKRFKGMVYCFYKNKEHKYIAITKAKGTEEKGKVFIPLSILKAYRTKLQQLINEWPNLHPSVDDPSWTRTPSDTYTKTLLSGKHLFLFVLREKDRSIRVIQFYDGDRMTDISIEAEFSQELMKILKKPF